MKSNSNKMEIKPQAEAIENKQSNEISNEIWDELAEQSMQGDQYRRMSELKHADL